jgi:hypothetical protein
MTEVSEKATSREEVATYYTDLHQPKEREKIALLA